MDQLLGSRHAAEAVMFAVMAIGAVLACIVCTIAVQWRKAREAEALAVLKQEMIQRGMSADDIVRVIDAGSTKAAAVREIG